MESKISVRDLSVAFGNRSIVKNLNFDLLPGENLCIIGQSGEGKSVLLKSIIGLIPHRTGKVLINGSEVAQNVEENTKKHDISISFQNDCLFDSMTILENLCFPLIYRSSIPRNTAIKISEKIIPKIGLSSAILKLYPSSLSGGMKKRIAIARAIITQPSIVFFDEPTTGLDPITSGRILDIVVDYIIQEKVSSITVTHSLWCAKRISNKVAMIHDGKIVWYGDTTSLETTKNEYIRNFLFHVQNRGE
ncbi:ABC transporter family protein [Neorickettsia helminthoeca str. Oregon]|uniref:ABC transporter family protein n=1 Tax=Neorickettsia helminthoeca str. Oregon TaxID=1286528 RepID=X5HMB5_9RICK|nr:ATP-binding cassette domain-containing protein [Neorickettsia helminthoeca]AHX11595.1 ABC transporter family protein [Neorickettsia helminthoeca str. Oregon]